MPLVAIAGFDPSGGAGVLIDTAVFRSFGFEAAAVLTAVTAQNTRKVYRLIPLPAGFLRDQIRVLGMGQSPGRFEGRMAGSAENPRRSPAAGPAPGRPPGSVDPSPPEPGQRLDGASVKTVLRVLRGTPGSIEFAEAARLRERLSRTISEMGGGGRLRPDRRPLSGQGRTPSGPSRQPPVRRPPGASIPAKTNRGRPSRNGVSLFRGPALLSRPDGRFNRGRGSGHRLDASGDPGGRPDRALAGGPASSARRPSPDLGR